MSVISPAADPIPSKINARHRDRQAVVYVRQSTPRQVERNRESTRLQYALVERARALGWRVDQVVVIDDDLGRSAAFTVDRPGFQRLVAEVGLGRVGLVLGIEVSRLARSCRDGHPLLEMCALFDTLIADADGVYDAANYNDRLLLGLKGTMSEAELHLLQARLLEGQRAKAQRGELAMNLPRGYVRHPSGQVIFDPDEQVQAVIRLVFEVFDRRRSMRALLRYLVDHDILLPDRVRSGPHKGEVGWNRPNRATLGDMLHHPGYAGAYAYGRRLTDHRLRRPGQPHSGRRYQPDPERWMVLRRDCWPAYIDWETYERNQAQMTANRIKHHGVPRGGPALLSGLVRCGRCGHRMALAYSDNGREARYVCNHLATTFGAPRCQSISAQPVDTLVADLMLAALAPSSIEVALQLAEDLEVERATLHQQWTHRLERARYEVTLARRRYEAVDPDNRLVARTLEWEWEAALASEQMLLVEHEHHCARAPVRLSEAEQSAIRRLAEDIPALWSAPTTTAADRQAIARLMLDQVVIEVAGATEHARVDCQWAGGPRTSHDLIRPVRRFEQLRDFDRLLARLTELRRQGLAARAIVDQLNSEGWRAPKRDRFNEPMVRQLLQRHGLGNTRPIWSGQVLRRHEDEWTLQELSERLGVGRQAVYGWLRRGRLQARMAKVGGQRIWLVTLTQADITRLRSPVSVNAGKQEP
ncbi:recombinase family protein [Azospirillum canadense]|uniref:recombinase family protein n=1 Tax=Azospirillum canadense TaxID=403962 RepID=UPI002227819A|nr:recombinase family protein [Azospirillum canadense]MCW2242379.1 DNA invertase Pin-like site-specific DNA recombinase [Azospirillum canadense]